jgi:hypothetical protein
MNPKKSPQSNSIPVLTNVLQEKEQHGKLNQIQKDAIGYKKKCKQIDKARSIIKRNR